MNNSIRSAIKTPRLPSKAELEMMSHYARLVVLRAYAQTLKAERDGLDVGFCWNDAVSLQLAKRSVKDRMRAVEHRADEFGIDVWSSKEQPDWMQVLRMAKRRYSSAA